MLDFLIGMAAGHILSDKKTPEISPERIYEHEQRSMLINIVHTASQIEKSNPTPDELRLQLQTLKMIFDKIDYNGLKSPEGQTVYQQVKDYFKENKL